MQSGSSFAVEPYGWSLRLRQRIDGIESFAASVNVTEFAE